MTVAQLIEKLQKLEPDTVVTMNGWEYEKGDFSLSEKSYHNKDDEFITYGEHVDLVNEP